MLIQTVYQKKKKIFFQEKQGLCTLTLLMNNRKPEIFLMLMPGTQGKYPQEQKT